MFSSNQKISGRQMGRLLVYDMMGISTLLLPGMLAQSMGADGIFAILFALIPALGVSYLIERAAKDKTAGYTNLVQKSVPPFLSRLIFLFYILEGIWVAGYALYLFGDFIMRNLLKEESFWLIIVIGILLGGYGIREGIEGRARIYELLFWVLLLPLLLMLLLAARDVDTSYWTPVFAHDAGSFLKGTALVFVFYMIILFALFFLPYLREDVQAGMQIRKSLIITAVLNAAVYLICLGVFGSSTLAGLPYPVLTLMSMVKLPGGFFERQDAFMVAIWFFTLYALMNTGMFYASELCRNLIKGMGTKWRIGVTMVLTFAAAALFYKVATVKTIFFTVQCYAAVPLCIGIPFVLYLVKGRKRCQCHE